MTVVKVRIRVMGMEINLLQAGKGDCILARCGTGIKKVNILIDSGMSQDYFVKALNRIAGNNEKIDLLIFTHDDNDHIKGAANLLKKMNQKSDGDKYVSLNTSLGLGKKSTKDCNKLLKELTDERILFNFGGYGTETLLGVTEAKQLFESFNELNIQKLAFVLADAEGEMNVPYPNMLQLKWKIAGNDLQSNIIWQPNSEELETETENEHLEIVILSPRKQALVDYIHGAWEKQQKKDVPLKAEKKKRQNEWEKSIQYWLWNMAEKKDKLTDANQASIAFLMIYGQHCGLFAGDASPEDMVSAGRMYLTRKKIKQDYMDVDFIKLPHHGSSHNASREFFEFFRTKTFFVTTEGYTQYRHPGKVTLALIASALGNKETADIYSSYSWWRDNTEFCRSEKSAGNWSMCGELCTLKDVDGTIKYLRFHKVGSDLVSIGKDIYVKN